VLPAKVKKTGSLHHESNASASPRETNLHWFLQCVNRPFFNQTFTGKGFHEF
jgi:predicted NAD/FAD-binding protein